jgi:hypothetical protein
MIDSKKHTLLGQEGLGAEKVVLKKKSGSKLPHSE